MAAKVFDGLFLGDAETSMDADFLDLNKISRLVNLAGQQVQNILSGHGFVYQTFCWEDQSDFLVFPAMEKDKALLDMVEFIDISLRKGLSVLVFSLRGMSRNAFAICAFLMFKYNWGFEKSFDFILSKKSDLQINQGFVQQLFALEKRLSNKRLKLLRLNDQLAEPEGPVRERLRRKEWDPVYLASTQSQLPSNSSSTHRTKGGKDKIKQRNTDEFSDNDGEDELLLVNSYLNSKNTLTVLPGPYRNVYDIQKFFKLRFNSVLQEEDVHVFPTNPPSRYDPPRGYRGILKKKYNPNIQGFEEEYAEVSSNGIKPAKPSTQSAPNPAAELSFSRPTSMSSRGNNGEESSGVRQTVTAAKSRGSSADEITAVQYRSTVQDSDNLNGRGGQQMSSSSSVRPRETSAAAENRDLYYYVGLEAEQPTNSNVRGSQTAEDRLRNLMQDMRVSSQANGTPKGEEKQTRGPATRSHKDVDNFDRPGAKDRDFNEYESTSDWASDRRIRGTGGGGGGGSAPRIDAADSKDRYNYKSQESLSLYDLAALPLHLEVSGNGKESKYGDEDGYGPIYGYNADEMRTSITTRNPLAATNDRIALANAEELRDRERDNAYLKQHESQLERRRDNGRDVDPLSAFQQQGQEAAVRVRYTTAPLPVGTNTPSRVVRNAWQEDTSRGRGDGGSGTRDRPPLPVSSRGGSSNQSVDSRNSDRLSVTSLQPGDRDREKTARTYRHGSPAPSRISASSRTAVPTRGPPFPSSSGAVNGQRARAASPSTGSMRGSSPGPGTMRGGESDLNRSRGGTPTSSRTQQPQQPQQQQRRGSVDSANGSLGDSRSLAGSEISQDSNPRAYLANSTRGASTSAGVGNRFARPPSPGTRKASNSATFSTGGSAYPGASQSNGRSSTPTRGGWRF